MPANDRLPPPIIPRKLSDFTIYEEDESYAIYDVFGVWHFGFSFINGVFQGCLMSMDATDVRIAVPMYLMPTIINNFLSTFPHE